MFKSTRTVYCSDLFTRQDSQNFLSRDKELSAFDSNSLGFSVSYDFVQNGWRWIDRGSVNLSYDHIGFNYDDFRDLRDTGAPVGDEPLYKFSADVAQFFVSIRLLSIQYNQLYYQCYVGALRKRDDRGCDPLLRW